MRTIILLTIFLFVMEMCMAKKEMNCLRISHCPEYKNYTMVLKNIVLKKNGRGKTVALKMVMLVKKEIKRMMVIVTFMKCSNPENLDTCEYFIKDFKVKNICDIMGKGKQSWSASFSNSNFPKTCPIPAGTYTMNETNIDDDMQLALMPVPIALWKVRMFLYDAGNDNVMITCTDLLVQVYNAKK